MPRKKKGGRSVATDQPANIETDKVGQTRYPHSSTPNPSPVNAISGYTLVHLYIADELYAALRALCQCHPARLTVEDAIPDFIWLGITALETQGKGIGQRLQARLN